jgi:hypothetical protein
MNPITEGVLRGACLKAAKKALREGRLFFRVSDGYGRSCNGGTGRVLPATEMEPGPWTERVERPSICRSGWHATLDPIRWSGQRVALVEVDEVCDRQEDKVVCHCMRELGVVVPWACVDDRIWVAASRPNLDGASLDRASLVGARLDRARLDRASLVGASLGGSTACNHTTWTKGFDPKAHGITVRDD